MAKFRSMFERLINIPKSQSFFLFGARGTGKTTLIQLFPNQQSAYIDLLQNKTETEYALNPDLLESYVNALPTQTDTVIIDEIQKVPKLLDIVHRLIERTHKRFILTGSSARKLKSGSANLLAGRAVERHLYSLTHQELNNVFNMNDVLRWGSLPKIFSLQEDSEKDDFLEAYANMYLKEEVWAEQLVRNLEPFRKFLIIAARSDGKILNYLSFAKQVGVDSKTVRSYFQILEDTLIGFHLDAYHTSERQRSVRHPKFYFFDTGVTRGLARLLPSVPIPGTSYYGDVFESWFIGECFRLNDYLRKRFSFSFYSDYDSGAQVDLVIERPGQKSIIIEIKSSESVNENYIDGLEKALPLFPTAEARLISQDKHTKKFGNIVAEHWQEALKNIFS